MRQQVRVLPLLALLAVPAALVGGGCEDPREELRGSAVKRSVEEPILNGSPDADHAAVVWLYDENSGSSCTGTIIATNGSSGYVLTAAHCTGIDYVAIATNYNDCFGGGGPACTEVFQVVDQIYHPDYNGDAGYGYDFSMIRFVGASGSTPVIPAAQPDDGLSSASTVDIVGFGQIIHRLTDINVQHAGFTVINRE